MRGLYDDKRSSEKLRNHRQDGKINETDIFG